MSSLFEPRATPVPMVGFASVALEQGIDLSPTGLTYAIPASLGDLRVGERVLVPLGKRDKPVAGFVTQISDHPDEATDTHSQPTARRSSRSARTSGSIKTILSRDPQAISITDDLVALACWMASYYCCPLGMVFSSMLPAAVKRGTGTTIQTMVRLAEANQASDADALSADESPGESKKPAKKHTPLQQAILGHAQALQDQDQPWIEIKQLAQAAGACSVAPVKRLIQQGLLTAKQETTFRSYGHDPAPSDPADLESKPPLALTTDQDHAVQQVIRQINDDRSGFGVYLLHGVTGSGKTEVYLRVIEHLLSKGPDVSPPGDLSAAAIVLVPEIALTPQTVTRFLARFDSVAVLHSGLTASQRHEQWRRIREGKAKVVVGARSAVFAPLPRAKLIIVDEEHDSSYKQDQLPRYHGRDVAVKRAQILGIPVILGSATPSLESYHNATVRNSYHLLRLPKRVTGLTLPTVQIVDMKLQRQRRAGWHLLSEPLEQTLSQVLADRGQTLLLLNRRGWANYIACRDAHCGWIMNCQYCDAMMVYHKDDELPTGGLLRCHHCRAEQMLPRACPVCNKSVVVFGLGTQRVEDEIARKFPNARMLRMDSDAMRTGRDYQQTLEAFGRGEVDLLVGTQMIAKGLDFPNVRLVGVISADTALHMPDFRAAERTFQLVAQVAGRAGRGDRPGRVIVQTFQPDDASITLASQHDYESFAQREMRIRQDSNLPPFARMARIVVRNLDPLAADKHASDLTDQLHLANTELGHPVEVRGPMPCPVARIAGYYRHQIEVITSPSPQPNPRSAAGLQTLFTMLRNQRLLISDAQTAVDVDPVILQ